MTNEDVKTAVEQKHLFYISAEMDAYIKKNYTKGDSEGTFYKVCLDGNDAKYGHYMVNPTTMHYRASTFQEFYGSGIVD